MKVTKLSEAILILKLQFSCDVEKSNIKGFEWVIPAIEYLCEDTHIETTEKLILFVNEIFKEEHLIEKVIDQIKYDITMGDVTAIDELLRFVPLENLLNFLPHNL